MGKSTERSHIREIALILIGKGNVYQMCEISQVHIIRDIPLSYDSITYQICISQNTIIFRQQCLCV